MTAPNSVSTPVRRFVQKSKCSFQKLQIAQIFEKWINKLTSCYFCASYRKSNFYRKSCISPGEQKLEEVNFKYFTQNLPLATSIYTLGRGLNISLLHHVKEVKRKQLDKFQKTRFIFTLFFHLACLYVLSLN